MASCGELAHAQTVNARERAISSQRVSNIYRFASDGHADIHATRVAPPLAPSPFLARRPAVRTRAAAGRASEGGRQRLLNCERASAQVHSYSLDLPILPILQAWRTRDRESREVEKAKETVRSEGERADTISLRSQRARGIIALSSRRPERNSRQVRAISAAGLATSSLATTTLQVAVF